MGRSSAVITMDQAKLYANQGNNPKPKTINSKNAYYDDGTTITMQLQEFVGGIESYSTFFDAGRHEHFMLQVEGQDFAVVMPFNDVAENFPVFEVLDKTPLKTAKVMFAEACARGEVVLTHGKKPFGLLRSYVELAPE